VALNAVPNLIFIALAPLIIGLLTYNRYTDAYPFAQIYALKNISISFYHASSSVIVGYGFTKSQLSFVITGAVLSYFMFQALIDRFGFYGAAWGQVLSMLIIASLAFGFIVVKFNLFGKLKGRFHQL